MSPLLTVAEAAAYLRKEPKTLYNWRSLGQGPKAIKVGASVLYRQRDIERWLDQQQTRRSA